MKIITLSTFFKKINRNLLKKKKKKKSANSKLIRFLILKL